MIFEIATQWDGKPIDHAPVKIKLQKALNESISLEIDAPFFDDPKPDGVAGKPFPQLWDYEGNHIFSIHFNFISVNSCFIIYIFMELVTFS